jgi:hypothetical protein
MTLIASQGRRDRFDGHSSKILRQLPSRRGGYTAEYVGASPP